VSQPAFQKQIVVAHLRARDRKPAMTSTCSHFDQKTEQKGKQMIAVAPSPGGGNRIANNSTWCTYKTEALNKGTEN